MVDKPISVIDSANNTCTLFNSSAGKIGMHFECLPVYPSSQHNLNYLARCAFELILFIKSIYTCLGLPYLPFGICFLLHHLFRIGLHYNDYHWYRGCNFLFLHLINADKITSQHAN